MQQERLRIDIGYSFQVMKRAEHQEYSRVPVSGSLQMGQTSVRDDMRTVHPALGQGNGSAALLKSLPNVMSITV